MAIKLFKRYDKVMITGIGYGYIQDVLEDSYHVYISNKNISGSGYQDHDLTLGWDKETWRQHKKDQLQR